MLRRALTICVCAIVLSLIAGCTSSEEVPGTSSLEAGSRETANLAASVARVDQNQVDDAAVERAARAQLATWKSVQCPAGGSTDEAFFDPLPNDGDTPVDVDPGEQWLGYEVERVADVHLPNGIMIESDAASLGQGQDPVRISEPGTYPFFIAFSVYEDRQTPAFGQLVFDASATPVRWIVDDRLGFTTDGGAWLGSPAAAISEPTTGASLDTAAWKIVRDELRDAYRDDGTSCVTWQRSNGANFVQYSHGPDDGFFTAASGYDADGDLVAVTWVYETGPWTLAGIPGTPPASVQETYAAN